MHWLLHNVITNRSCTDEVEAKRSSKYHEKCDKYEKLGCHPNGDRYAKIIVNKVMPAIRQKVLWLVYECRAGHFDSTIVI